MADEKKTEGALNVVLPEGDVLSEAYARSFQRFHDLIMNKGTDEKPLYLMLKEEQVMALWIDFQTNLRTEYIGRGKIATEEKKAVELASTPQLSYIRSMSERGGHAAQVLSDFLKDRCKLESITKEQASELITKMKAS